VTSGSEQERDRVGELATQIRELTNGRVTLAYIDQGYTGPHAAAAAQQEIELEVMKHTAAKKGFVLLPRRWGGRTNLRLARTPSTTGSRR
jgi:hypothetical protein